MSTYITLGLVFVPKIVHLHRIPKRGDESNGTKPLYHPNLSKIEQKRYQQLTNENADLKLQVEHKEKRIADFRQRLGKYVQETAGIALRERVCGSISDEITTQSSSTILKTTALLEARENTG
ncbi:unnamed protein product [Gongylonema pulchrum]|uniref:Uncharacterized protein n=1 Tax=Gongylonema pulchrum TaxID=637853 RepID=A0A3P7MY34_9BILA|nr:unnamed protein product [Gongylonema pulchrum]